MDIRVNISGNANFFVPVLSGSPDEARRLLRYYEKELEGRKTDEAAALLDFLQDFLEECQEEQKQLLEAMDYAQATPSLSQAQRLKKYSQEGKCTLEVMCTVMDEEKKTDLDRVIIKQDVLRKYFPKSYTPKQMEDTIIRLLEQWQRKKQREQER